MKRKIICSLLFPWFFSSPVVGEESSKNPDGLVSIPTMPRPGYLDSNIDPVFGSKVTRLTDEPGKLIKNIDARWDKVARHGYSKEPAWNSDQSILLLRQHQGFPSLIVLDGTTCEPIFGRSNGPGPKLVGNPGNRTICSM
jgi:hypothetical protein